ncbi:MAG: ATP synthase F1 subunit delta [Candidatus Bipolaricaulota bacterium]|nr:ATP synthase F1 subunit delta [Candidatus Bipolaricaulota bacterium]
MRSREIARRYAEALYKLAAEEGLADTIEEDYSHVLTEIEGVPDFDRFFTHPLVSRDKKGELIDQAFPDLSEYLHNLLALLIHNGREGYLDLIYEEFRSLRSEEEGIVRVKVLTAKELSTKDCGRLTDRLAVGLGKRVELEEEIDASLIGGVRIEIGGKVLDGTLRTRLEGLRSFIEG